jgi:predicted lipid-binding transport protein (Tim44 family)
MSAATTMRRVRETALIIALGVGVTVVGLVTGALIMSPAVTRQQRLMGVAVLAGLALCVLVVMGAMRLMRRLSARRAKSRVHALAGARAKTPMNVPTMSRPTRTGRTPRAVHAMAQAGAAPTEIAWKTGLPVDAVSMLLELAPAR